MLVLDTEVFMCRSCVLLMDGYFQDPLTARPTEELISIIKEQRVEIQSLKDTLYGIANKMAEQIAQDAKR